MFHKQRYLPLYAPPPPRPQLSPQTPFSHPLRHRSILCHMSVYLRFCVFVTLEYVDCVSNQSAKVYRASGQTYSSIAARKWLCQRPSGGDATLQMMGPMSRSHLPSNGSTFFDKHVISYRCFFHVSYSSTVYLGTGLVLIERHVHLQTLCSMPKVSFCMIAKNYI